MAVSLAASVTAFLVSFIMLPVIIKYFLEKKLVDVPDRRKIHRKLTPSMGGIAIFIGFLVATIIWMELDYWQQMRYVIASLFIIFLLGVRDDLVPFRASHKLYGQIIAVAILLFSNVRIESLYGFMGIYEIPLWLSYFLTAFTVIVITNSFNLIDGLDGLAGSIGMVTLSTFGVWFYFAGDNLFSLLCLAMSGSILAFLVFNWEPSEIFMGDTGAMVIGMLLSVLVIHFMSLNESLPDSSLVKFSATIGTAACFIIIPLSDTLRIIILRLSKGQSPFRPDKNHIHHSIMRLGFTHARTTIILACVNAIFVISAFVFRNYGDRYVIPTLILISMALSIFLDRKILNKRSIKTSS
jgi:UDP-GlcNAc:undecaprenyl-phosphate/decaprenyl-phosphate GlcNAc-1-phosphate transferase